MSDYFEQLTAHYRDVRARLDGRPAQPWVQPQAPALAPAAAPLPKRVLEPGIEPDTTPPAFHEWITPLPSEAVQIHPLPGVTCSPDTKRAIAAVLDRLGMTWAQANARSNAHVHANARAEIYVLLRERGWSYPRIGALMDGRDHTTIMTSVQRYHARKGTA